MRVLFMGTGDIAIPAFERLLQSEVETIALVTQPDKPVGRKQILTAPKIKEVALDQGITVLQPQKLRDADAVSELKAFDADVFVVMAYGQILSTEVLGLPKVACINLHASLLPKHRGASCIQQAILEGDAETGITVMHMSEGLDEGDIIISKSVTIGQSETGGELHDRLAELAPDAMIEALVKLANGTSQRVAQDEAAANYAAKLLRNHGVIDWTQSAQQLERKIRAYEPWPGTFCVFTDAKGRSKRMKIFPPCEFTEAQGRPGEILAIDQNLQIACGDGSLVIQEIQPEGSKRMRVEDFAHSGTLQVGDILS